MMIIFLVVVIIKSTVLGGSTERFKVALTTVTSSTQHTHTLTPTPYHTHSPTNLTLPPPHTHTHARTLSHFSQTHRNTHRPPFTPPPPTHTYRRAVGCGWVGGGQRRGGIDMAVKKDPYRKCKSMWFRNTKQNKQNKFIYIKSEWRSIWGEPV